MSNPQSNRPKRKQSPSPSPSSLTASKRTRIDIPPTTGVGSLMSKVMSAANKRHNPKTPVRCGPKKPTQSKDDLIALIISFVEKYSIRQHTHEWYKLMEKTIGGSELATVLGITPKKYGTRSQLVEKKRVNGNANQEVSIFCAWGNLFEPIIRSYTEVVLDTQIYGHDICIEKGRFRFSPDGLGVVRRRKGYDVFDIVLFEFKCPFFRNPDGKVPDWYMPQVFQG